MKKPITVILLSCAVLAFVNLEMVSAQELLYYSETPIGYGTEKTDYKNLDGLLEVPPVLYVDNENQIDVKGQNCVKIDFNRDGDDELLFYAFSDMTHGFCWAVYDEKDGSVQRVAKNADCIDYESWEVGITGKGSIVHTGGGGQSQTTIGWTTYIYWNKGEANYLYESCVSSGGLPNADGSVSVSENKSWFLNGEAINEDEYIELRDRFAGDTVHWMEQHGWSS